MESIIRNPFIPYLDFIYDGSILPEKIIRIQGTIPENSYRFDISLQCGPSIEPRSDVALQLTVYRADGYVSLNSLQNRKWGEEQREDILPFEGSQDFELVITCDYFNKYMISINGKCNYEFPQRINYTRAIYLGIFGEVSINQISYESDTSMDASSSIVIFDSMSKNKVLDTGDYYVNAATLPIRTCQPHIIGDKQIVPAITPESTRHFSNIEPFPTNVTFGSGIRPNPYAPLTTLANGNIGKPTQTKKIIMASVTVILAIAVIALVLFAFLKRSSEKLQDQREIN